jgi:hypothetical protein
MSHVSGTTKVGVAGTYNKALYLRERKAAPTAVGGSLYGPGRASQGTAPKTLMTSAPTRTA